MALDYQTYTFPLAAGLNTKADERALEPPELRTCKNAKFDELGGIQNRHPFSQAGSQLTDLRRLAVYENELLAFTKDKLYSWSDQDSDWIEKDTYFAPVVTEESVFTRSPEQDSPDRAQLSGVTVYVWKDVGDQAYAAALDASTGAVLVGPTAQGASTTRPKVLALDSKILLFVKESTTELKVKDIDPTSQSSLETDLESSSWTTIETTRIQAYDVAEKTSTTAAVLWTRPGETDETGWAVVDEDATISSQNTVTRSSSGPVAVAVSPDGWIFGFRDDGSMNVKVDVYTSAFADHAVDTTIGTISSGSFDHFAAAVRSHQTATEQTAGVYRCYIFWSANETDSDSAFETKYNYMLTDAATTGSQATFVKRLGIASRAFVHDGYVFLWLVFAGDSRAGSMNPEGTALQNTCFLFRDDLELVAKAAMNAAGGFHQHTGPLPTVQDLGSNKFACCVTERRLVRTGDEGDEFSGRGPREVQIEFDADAARRCVQLGRTLYIAGGQILQYDGEGLTEVGFHSYPWYFAAVDSGSGSIADGDYSYVCSLYWQNAKGEEERSTTATVETVTASGGTSAVAITAIPLHVTKKQGARSDPSFRVWRTRKDPPQGANFYLVTDLDPTATGDNRYIENDPSSNFFSTFDDVLADSSIADNAAYPENGAELASLAPPPASIIAAGPDRIFLAGIANDSHAVWYSKLRGGSEVAAFNGGNVVRLPKSGGDIKAIAVINRTPVIFKETAIYSLDGYGYTNVGGGANYEPRLVSPDVGATSGDAVAVTPDGVFFHSLKGWFQLDRSLSPRYVGGKIDEYDSSTFTAVHVMESEHQVRCVGKSSEVLVYDMIAQQWSEWTISDALHAVIHDGTYKYAGDDGYLYTEDSAAGGGHQLDIETAPIKLAGLIGDMNVRWISILGEYRSAHDLRIRLTRDDKTSEFQDTTWTVSPTTVGGPELVKLGPSITKVRSLRVRITSQAVGSTSAPSGEGLKLTGLALEVGFRRGLHRVPQAQKA